MATSTHTGHTGENTGSRTADISGDTDGGVTTDRFLNGRITLRQPATGYRAAIDPVMLAAATPRLRPGEQLLEPGCGVGTASLCYGCRVPGAQIVGLEADADLATLARQNARVNGKGGSGSDGACFTVITGRLPDCRGALGTGGFDQVMSNPPYLHAEGAFPSPVPGRSMARTEGDANLETWLRFMLDMLRPRGGLTLIHRADRLAEILALLSGPAGEITVYPLWPRSGVPARRVILRARKGVRGGTRLLPGLVLHDDGPGNGFTAAAEAVLRDAAPLPGL